MKKVSLIFGFMLTALFCNAQQVENARTVKTSDPLKDYLRPSLTVLFIDRGESLSEKLIAQMAANGIPGKFNDNSIETNVLRVNGSISERDLQADIEENVTRQIMRRWFPSFDTEKKEWDLSVVHERGMYNATDADVLKAKAATLKEALLKDKGLDLIARSYILVYDFYGIQAVKTENSEGYQTNCNVFLYQLDWSDVVKSNFYDQWENPNAIDEMKFPVKHIASLLSQSNLTPVKVTQANSGDLLRLSQEKLFEAFTKEIEKMADVYLTQVNEDFKVKAPIFSVSPVRAKIGTKEGVKVDQRYFAYEIQLNAAGEEVPKRKGVVRATSSIVKNDTIATGEGGTTKFYQTYGRNLQPGMLLQQKPDFGVGLSVSGGSDLNILGEFSVGMWLGKYIPALQNIKVPYGSKIYLRYSLPFSTMEVEGDKLKDEKDKEMKWASFAFGISKDFYFAHIFSVTPYLGYSSLLVPDKYQDAIKALELSSGGFDVGLNASAAILHNVQVVGNIGYNGAKADLYSSAVSFGVGVRIQY